MSYDRLHRTESAIQSIGSQIGGWPGKRTLTERLLRRAAPDASERVLAPHAMARVERADGSSGAALPEPLRARFEQSLGADLGGVRVHTGAESALAAQAVNARAYTLGQAIHFGAGQYDPSSPSGAHLLAHEVAHTLQQRGAATAPQYKLEVSMPGDSLESEADAAADAMVRGLPASVGGAGHGVAPSLFRQVGDHGHGHAGESGHGSGSGHHAEAPENGGAGAHAGDAASLRHTIAIANATQLMQIGRALHAAAAGVARGTSSLVPVRVGATTFTVPSDQLGALEELVAVRMDYVDLRELIDRADPHTQRPMIAAAIQRAMQQRSGAFTQVSLRGGAEGTGSRMASGSVVTMSARTFRVQSQDLEALYRHAEATQPSQRQIAADDAAPGWALRLAIELAPIVGPLVQAVEALTGRGIVTGERLGAGERALLALSAIISALGARVESVTALARLQPEVAALRIRGAARQAITTERALEIARTLRNVDHHIAGLAPSEAAALEAIHHSPHVLHRIHAALEAQHTAHAVQHGAAPSSGHH